VPFPLSPSLIAFSSREGVLLDLPLCAASHPPTHWHTETCQLARARAFQFFIPLSRGVAKAAFYCVHRAALSPLNDPSKLVLTLSQGVASDCPLLRASNEALLRARVPRARRTSEVAPSSPF
jgi:hypothetical protein